MTPAGAQVSLTGGFAARIAAAVAAALAPHLDSIAASVTAVKLQQGVAGGQLTTLQTTLEGIVGTQALTAAQLEASQAATAADLATIKTGVTGLTTQITLQTAHWARPWSARRAAPISK